MSLLVAFLLVGATWLLSKVLTKIHRQTPLDNLPGPPPSSWKTGNMSDVFNRFSWDFLDAIETYGGVTKLHGMFGSTMLHVHDPAALHYIYQHAFEPPAWFTESFKYIFGPGIAGTSGAVHRKQRKLLLPVFALEHLRRLVPTFQSVTQKLCDAICIQIGKEPRILDIHHLLGRVTLEILGQSILGRSFDPLSHFEPNAFVDAMGKIGPAALKLGRWRFFAPYFKYLGPPAFRRKLVYLLPLPAFHEVARLTDIVYHMAKTIVDEKRAAIVTEGEAVDGQEKDLMKILLTTNMKARADERLSDDEIYGQVGAFLFAGTGTTVTTITQVLHLLAERPDVQDKLRQELCQACQDEDPSYEELNSLSYLDAVCRETLRLYPSSTFVYKEAPEDTMLPLSKPILGRNGATIDFVPVSKGTTLAIGIRASGRNKAVWGDDALEWKPERWLSPLPQSVAEAGIPGIYPNVMTFSGGQRSCIGFKFSELEMKVVLAKMVKMFSFTLPDNHNVVWNMAGVKYPTAGEDSEEPSFPIRISTV